MSSGRSAGRSRAGRAERAAGKADTAAPAGGGGGGGGGGSQSQPEKPATKPHTHHSKLKEDKVYEDKISQVVQLTGKTKDEAEIALYDCDYDPTRAINMLLEGDDQGEWVEKTKKKKPPKPTPPESRSAENHRPQEDERAERDRSRAGRGGQPPRLRRGGGQDRSWKARETRENEKNAAGGGGDGERPRWGRGGARGGRGGRRGLGARSFQGRPRGDDFASIDTWTNPGGDAGGSWDQTFPPADDWDNEEWAGSLSDTKVFTPSAPAQPAAAPAPDASPPAALAEPPAASTLGPSLDLSALLGKPAAGSGTNGAGAYSQFGSAPPEGDTAAASSAPSASAGGTYSYSSATSRSAPAPAAPAYPSGYTNPPGLIYSSSNYVSESYQSPLKSSAPAAAASSAPAATTVSQAPSIPQPRTRVQRPPPKIPESAVEMPEELVSSLEVKFGGLGFGLADTKSSFTAASESDADGFSSSGAPPAAEQQTMAPLSAPSQPAKSPLEAPAGYSAPSSAAAADPAASSASFPPAPGLYSSPSKAAASSGAPAGFPPAPSVSGASFAQLSAGYSGQVTAPGFSPPAASTAAPSAFSQAAASSAFPSSSFASSSYSGAGAFNGGAYSVPGSAALTGNSLQEKLTNALAGAAKASQYDPSSPASSLSDGVSTAASSLPAGLSSSATSAGPSSAQNASGRTHAASTRSGSVPSVPPGVPMQYFVGQTGMPTFYPGVQQIYGYEEMQALQQRLPHLQQQQQAAAAAAAQQAGGSQGRGDAAAALVAAMADTKYSRQEAASPVQSSLNPQGQQQQQQPFFNAAAAAGIPPNYTYFPFVPQYSIYTPMPPATNAAHQASSGGSQYPKMAYNAASFAGSAYDTLASAAGADYKAAQFGSSAAHKLAGSGSAGAADLYGKMQQLGGKFDNKGFHAATPPPFSLAAGQPQTTPLAAPGGYAPHMFIQPLPAQHQLVHPAHAESAPQRAAAANKPAAKNSYGGGYWPAN
ncbi:ubiquitin-associated protein 2-like isoform X3 [Amphibalanus amphitrite]|uniref:ubiquitin-associated protein 2-like isoform X3 n=1 Tax=Amphibalanus amphitrite TaxID=1232801 RepID=UPI001C91887D|nr:ubiquitin-associated protein 2-like isoform X3 [Amphibalanus amphitrite]